MIDANKACLEAAMDTTVNVDAAAQLAAKKACFTASITSAADAMGVEYDSATKAENSEDKLNVLKFHKVRKEGRDEALKGHAAACKAENDKSESCTPAKFVEVIKNSFGATSDGVDPITITTKVDNTELVGAVTSAAIVAAKGEADATTKENMWKADYKRAAMKKICQYFTACMKDPARNAATCKADVVTFAKRMLRTNEVDASKFVRFALQECRARIMADAVECDPTLKDACKEALVDNRGATEKDVPGANAPETINAGGEDHTRGVEEPLVAKKEAAKKYAHCKMVYTTSEWSAHVKEACLEKAKGSFQDNGGNVGQWTDIHMSKVEKLGDSYAKGETTVIATKPSIDFCTEMAGTCGDA